MKKNELEWIYCSNKQVTSKFKISSVKKVSSELIKWYDDSFHRLRIETMLKTKLYQQMFRSMRYSYRSFDFRFNLGTLYIFNTAFRVVNDFFLFRTLCPTCALLLSNILCFYRTHCWCSCDTHRCAHTTKPVLGFFISSGYAAKDSRHTLWKRSRNLLYTRNFF